MYWTEWSGHEIVNTPEVKTDCWARSITPKGDLAEFAKKKDNGDLKGAYRQLKVTLKTINISWIERGRKSVEPSKQYFCRHYSELVRARTAPGMTASREPRLSLPRPPWHLLIPNKSQWRSDAYPRNSYQC